MTVEQLLEFYSGLGRPMTLMEISRLAGVSPQNASAELETLVARKKIRESEGFYFRAAANLSAAARKKQDLLGDAKWRKLERLARWFRSVPFIDFVFASGSIAIGNVGLNSDFDLLIGVRSGRIFTVRYLLNFCFGLIGQRRLDDAEGSSPDKLCFNHFVTEATALKPPWNVYRRQLYANLIPIYGDPAEIKKLFPANIENSRFQAGGLNFIGTVLKLALGGRLGDRVENGALAPIAKKRLAAYIARKSKEGRVVVSDAELEFHFDLRYEKRFERLQF